MLSLKIIIFIVIPYFFIGNIMGRYAIEIIPKRIDVTYRNMKHLDYFNLTAKRPNRHTPYVLYLDVQAKHEMGNNISVKLKLYELISGRYVPTMFQYQYKFCDWLNKDILGRFWKAVLDNITCPIPKRRVTFNLVAWTVNVSYHIPFTWNPYVVSTRLDVEFFQTTTKEALVAYISYVDIKQKPLEGSGSQKHNYIIL